MKIFVCKLQQQIIKKDIYTKNRHAKMQRYFRIVNKAAISQE